jgi:hypothetical protein
MLRAEGLMRLPVEVVTQWRLKAKIEKVAIPAGPVRQPMEKICILFDRNDEIMSAETCDCQCNAEKRMYLSYKLINTSTKTSAHVDLGTRLSTLLEANMIASTLVPVDETIKYNEDDEEDNEYIPNWQQA